MALHGLTQVTIGVPNVAETAAYYQEFGLRPVGEGRFTTVDGGEQLRLVGAPYRRLVELGVAVDDTDDLDRVAASLRRLDLPVQRRAGELRVIEPTAQVSVVLTVAPRLRQPHEPAAATNGPGRGDRVGARAASVLRAEPVRPRKLGHVVLGSTDIEAIRRFFIDGLGFRVSDEMAGRAAFLRCSTDHHNLLVQQAPVSFLHHTSWQVEDVDEVARGATSLLERDPDRHVWGLGRHHVGSNFFWYLKDPAGNFSEYYSDLDVILDDQLWKPEVFEGRIAFCSWGPPVPPSFIRPEDLAELMVGAHAPRASAPR